jgi:ADP-ribose pyrophosphatase YjhB (NUDIX family)
MPHFVHSPRLSKKFLFLTTSAIISTLLYYHKSFLFVSAFARRPPWVSFRGREAPIKQYFATSTTTRKMAASSSNDSTTEKKYAPSQYIIDESTGEKWRLCVGAAVLNSDNQLLVGERLGVPGAWQAPQGGVDDAHDNKPKETFQKAASRELFEEMGLVEGTHVVLALDPSKISDDDKEESSSSYAVRYNTGGSANWLTKAGFAGQELHWVIYRCADARADKDASMMVDLSGKGGEDPEFSQAKWQDLSGVMEQIWEKKRGPYEALQKILSQCNVESVWEEKKRCLDFTGKWSRDLTLCQDLVKGLTERGLSDTEAQNEAHKPYIQSWHRDNDASLTWNVKTYETDGLTIRRDIHYIPGEWTESYKGNSTLFGNCDAEFSLKRSTIFVAEPDGYPNQLAHVTITDGPKGIEESRRYINDKDQLILRRTLWKAGEDAAEKVVSTEIFTRT